MGQLDDAAKAYREAEQALARAQDTARTRIEAARQRRADARDQLRAAIIAAARAGTPQVEIIRITGYSRERVRTILREGGVDPE